MNATITFHELAELMAEATSTTNRMCELFLRELFSTISQTLIEGESVKIKGIGTFKVTQVKPRKSTNVNTGEAIVISGYNKLSFTPDKSLAEAVNQPFAQFETVELADEVTNEKLAEIDEQYPSALTDDETETRSDTPIQQQKSALLDQIPNEQDETPIFAEDEALPDMPDMPLAPLPDDLPQMQEAAPIPEFLRGTEPIKDKQEPTKIEPEASKPETEPVKVESVPVVPEAKTEKEEQKPVTEEQETTKVDHQPIEPIVEPVKQKPMLVGIPIDGPSQPVPDDEPEEEVDTNRHFYRPEPRNVYTPTPEQIEEAQRKPKHRWLWWIPALIAAALLFWLLARSCSNGTTDQEVPVIEQADTVVTVEEDAAENTATKAKQEKISEPAEQAKPEPKPEVKSEPEVKPEPKPEPKPAGNNKVVTDVVTSQIVLTTLAEKHYGSPWFWVYIYEENRNIISNPNNIRPGTRVVIPPAEKYGINPNDKASLKKAQIKSMEYLKGY